MPMQFTIDRARRRVVVRANGIVTEPDLAALRARVLADAAFDAGMSQLIDLRSATLVGVSKKAIERLASTSVTTTPVRRAFVVTSDHDASLIRMFETLRAAGRNEVEIFRDRHEAEAWLDSRPPE